MASDSVHERAHVRHDEEAQPEVRKKSTLDASWNDKLNMSWVDPMCHMEEHAEYEGDKVVRWGADHIKVGSSRGWRCSHALSTCCYWHCGLGYSAVH
jgi:hypothetical protein